MSTINGVSYQDPRNINLKGGARGTGLIRWTPPTSGVPALWSTNPFTSDDYGLYINSSGELVFSALGTITVLSTAAGGGISSWNGLYGTGQSMTVSAAAMTFDGTHGSNDVFVVTNSGAGSGDLIQITNSGSGKDINGTSGTWSFDKTGVMVAKSATFSGTAGSDSFTLTAGDMVLSDSSLTIVDADNAGTFVVTNNTVSTSVFSTWTMNGLTSGGGLLITSSGTIATTGYLLTLTGNSATTAAGLFRINANALTSGIAAVITSSATAITGAGRLLRVDHTGATGTSAVLSEFASAANDETVILRVTSSAALAGGVAFDVSGSSVTTGTLIRSSNADALTTGSILSLASNSSSTSTRSLVSVTNTNTAATGTTPIAVTNQAVTGTGSKFVKMMSFSQTSKTVTVWISIDGTTPNGALTGTAGDICLNGPSSRMFYCTGTTNWTASNA